MILGIWVAYRVIRGCWRWQDNEQSELGELASHFPGAGDGFFREDRFVPDGRSSIMLHWPNGWVAVMSLLCTGRLLVLVTLTLPGLVAASEAVVIRSPGALLDDSSSPYAGHLGYWLVGGLLVFGLLLIWVISVRRLLRRRTAQLEAALVTVPDLRFELALDGRCHAYHCLRSELLAVVPQGVTGKLISEVMPPKAAAVFVAALEEADAAGHSMGLQFELQPAQESFWFELSVAPKPTAFAKTRRFVVLARDISERKLAEAALLRRGEQLALMATATQEINSDLDLAVILRQLVAAAVKITGATGGAAARVLDGQMRFHEYNRGGDLLPVDYSFSPGYGVPGHVMQTRKSHLSNDVAHDPYVIKEIQQEIGFHNLLDTPIIGRHGDLLGCFEIHNKPQGFDDTDARLLQGLAASAAVALENSALLAERIQAEQALRESEGLQASVLASAACGIVATDPQGLITVFNAGAETILGYRADEMIGKLTPLVFHDDADVLAAAAALSAELGYRVEAGFDTLVARARRSDAVDEREAPLLCKDGRRITARLSVTVMRNSQGALTGYLGTVVDVTEQKKVAAQLGLAAKVFEQGGEGIAITDAECRIVMVNQAFTRITGYSEGEAIGQNPRLLASGRHDGTFYRGMWEAIDSLGYWQGEIWNRRKDGSVYPEWLSVSRVERDGATTNYIGTFIDISQHKEAEASIQRLAHFDPLTGLPNRSLLNERVKHDLIRAHRSRDSMALMFLDLDRFKNVNDSLGHRIGDELLIQVARRLSGAVREEDTVSRLGGDEFIIVLPSTDASGAAHVAGKLLEVAAPPYRIEQHELTCTASLGIAMYPADGDSFEALSMCADTAMYRAKQRGRNAYCFFTTEMQQRSARTLLLENDLRRALDNNELDVYFQPQFAIDGRCLTGAEALLRWQHPELGMVSPGEFIPIAEESGLILPIGEWVLRVAIRQMQAWQEAALPLLSVAVNLSAVQFRQANLAQVVSCILDEEGLPARFLELELTESAAMDNPLAAIEVMDQLRERGVRISIDDFGTDYSSMSYLKRFRVHKLKIDRSFIADLCSDPDDEAIVTAIIGLAHNLGLRTVAEGVETEAQLAFLQQRGCDEAQGYLFSEALPRAQFEALLRQRCRG